MIQHYRAEDGIQGYAEGDILIETGSGDTVAAVRDGRGVALTPTVADVPFAAAGDVRAIGLRLAPLDVGFDLRATGAAVAVGPGATLRASYATRDGARRVVSGPRAGVLAVLRAHGYDVVETTGGAIMLTSPTYVTDGAVRGACGHRHRTLAGAERCLARDQAGCATQGGYSDRSIYRMPGRDLMVPDGDGGYAPLAG